MSAIVNCVAYCNGARIKNIDIGEIGETLNQNGHFVWVGLHEPDEDLLMQVQRAFHLHELAIEDAHTAHQRPKIDTYGDSLFIVLRTAQQNDTEQKIDFGETHFFIGNNYLVTVRHGSTLSYSDVRARCESTPQLLRKGPAFALYAVMDSIVDRFFPVIHAFEQRLDSLEDNIFSEHASRETTAQTYHLKRELLELKRAVSPLIDLCNRLIRFDLDLIPEDTRPYFRDVYDHAVRINEMVDTLRELLTSALEAHFSLVSISQNEVSKRFAGWAAIIGVPTMIAGIYGMNFDSMPELHWNYGYPLIIAVITGVCLLLFLRFKKMGWL
jgi:magnesium transporter